jgi:hypothetical protein
LEQEIRDLRLRLDKSHEFEIRVISLQAELDSVKSRLALKERENEEIRVQAVSS